MLHDKNYQNLPMFHGVIQNITLAKFIWHTVHISKLNIILHFSSGGGRQVLLARLRADRTTCCCRSSCNRLASASLLPVHLILSFASCSNLLSSRTCTKNMNVKILTVDKNNATLIY